MGGLVKIAGQAKTTWSLLTEDSAHTHLSAPKSIRVDDCQHWRIGDALTIAATGGDALDWHSAIAQPGCPESDCSTAQLQSRVTPRCLNRQRSGGHMPR